MSTAQTAIDPNIVGLYGQALFKANDPPVNNEQLKALQGSGFTTVLLFALHVDQDGNLSYSDVPMAQNGQISNQANPQLPQLVAGLRQGGVDQVLITIGSADVLDYHHIQELLKTPQGREILLRNFTAVASFLGIDGFDFDDEEEGITTDTIAALAKMVYPLGRKNLLTAAPYTDQEFWLECLEKVFIQNGFQLFTWWNLQIYGGADADDWITAIAKLIAEDKVGLKSANAFIVPGYSLDEITPQQVCAAISRLTVGGGFLWNAAGVFQSTTPPKGWADAIVDGLHKRC